MFEHERFALTTYGLNNQLDTLEWTLETIPAEHVEAFKSWVSNRYRYALERLHEPDDPSDQAWWNERVNEWYDILRTLSREAKHE